jgi:chitodextrinase
MFNSFGQLLGIAFAPSRNRNQQATQSTGFNFTVEGLNASTTYSYEFVAYDDTDDVIETLSGSFTTTADTPTNIENQQSQITNRKYIESGHLFIDNNNRTFDALGQQVR